MNLQKQFILLDWDGTLGQTLGLWLRARRTVLEKYGFAQTDEEIASSFGALSEHFRKWGIDDATGAHIRQETYDLVLHKLPEVELYPNALEVLEALHTAGKQLALITTAQHRNIVHSLEHYDLARLFEVIIAQDDTKHHKPHPEPLEKALQIMGGKTQEAVMIGDSDKDLGAAKNAGIDSILFFPPEHAGFYNLEKLKTYEPTHIVSNFREIIEIVQA